MFRKFLFIGIFITAAVSVLQISKMYLADMYYESADDLLNEGRVEEAVLYAKQAVDLNPLEPNYYRGLAKAYLMQTLIAESEEDILYYKLLALENMQAAHYLNPHNLVTIRNLIPLYYFLSVKNMSLTSLENNTDEAMLPITRNFYNQVGDTYVTDAGVYALLAKYQKRLHLNNDYEESVSKIKKLRPDLLEWYVE